MTTMNVTGEVVYLLCTVTSAVCAALLFRGYARTGTRLLLWSGLCFTGLSLNNAALFLDLVVLPNVDLSIWRLVPAVLGVSVLCYGLIEEHG
jgi:hypothetical protein